MTFCFYIFGGVEVLVREAFASEETIALAKMKACEVLGVKEEDAEFEVLQMPERKKLGFFGGRLAQVRAYIKESVPEKAKNYIKEILFYMGLETLDVHIVFQSESECFIKITGDDVKYMVGRHGETLDAIQYIVGIVANKDSDKYCKIRIDAGEYREKRKKVLESLGRRMAYKAISEGKKIELEPMRSYERKLVHSAIQAVEGAKSWSEGEDSNRHVVVVPKDKPEVWKKSSDIRTDSYEQDESEYDF